MTLKVSQITVDELKELIGAAVEQKLVELFGDPDEGLVINNALHQRFLQQKKEVAEGERGELLDDVIIRLGLT